MYFILVRTVKRDIRLQWGNMAFRNHKGTINKLDVGLRRSIYDVGVPSVCYEYRWLIKNLFGPIVAKNGVRWEFKATRE